MQHGSFSFVDTCYDLRCKGGSYPLQNVFLLHYSDHYSELLCKITTKRFSYATKKKVLDGGEKGAKNRIH